MNTHHPTLDEPATADYVLSVLQDEHRQQCEYDGEADPEVVLSLETTVAEWRVACDLVGWLNLGRALNTLWGIQCSDAQWHETLEPARRRCLRDVCNVIAKHARRATIRPTTILGRECAPAAAFLTVRSLLHEAGAPASDIAPSTPLDYFARRYLRVFLGPISRLAPGAVPAVAIRQPVYEAGCQLLAVGMCLALLGSLLRLVGADLWNLFTILGVPIAAVGWAITWFAAKFLLPAEVRFGELRTFGDLAKCLSVGSALSEEN